ncbi:MAG: cytochrome c oxidase subunit II [Ignavibacteriaceae bacterium]|nr:cytochrome c oxidase subunit II [Ignavibacterium sp.]MCC6253767.1 cytochrome c oxidase subunit II [Ignavibacteriaceae bacterium]HRN25252.1 cytochrome c oxidase subunit II [Ignavibacteriaceae bacterium]HRP94042.1 cytochrome c oxidase subunit II [Ignavibacteriaceae bacterium]HRQ52843.1 cytochrome c oxidase subunit II [Ignavibacteriaceae bacterium]
MFNGASNFSHNVDAVFLFTLIVSVFFLVLITGLMIYFVIKYNRKRNPKATNYHGNIGLEITWTLIPTILVLIMFWYGWVGYSDMSEAPEDALNIEVTAQMWKWGFKYENGKSFDSLYVPINKAVKLTLTSLDVTHAFYIPKFRIKKDVYPNQTRTVWFKAEELGDFDIACAEYCGLNHSYMYNKVKVVPEADFDIWLYSNSNSTAVADSIKN